jgi:preprotein translocase subunit SecY
VIEAIANVLKIPDLRARIFFTLAMLGIYRLGIFIPAPGVDRVALGDFFANNQGTLLGLYDMFSGGALEQFSVFVLGIMPYISASIIMQLMQVVMPQIERLSKEGQTGRKKITQYTRYMTIGIAIVQSMGIAISLEQMKTVGGTDVVIESGWAFRAMTVVTMTAGACFVMWLGE